MMITTENRKLATVWKSGFPMWNAPRHFAPQSIRQKWDELSKVSAMAVSSEALQSRKGEALSGFDMLGVFLQGAMTVLGPREENSRAAESHLLKQIQERRVIGLGFEPPRLLRSTPIYIPVEYWRGCVSWDNSELQSQGLKFTEIRLISAQQARSIIDSINGEATNSIELKPQPIEEKALTIGRPSIQLYVQAAFVALKAMELIVATKSARSHFDIVRKWIAANTSYQGGELSNEGIRAHFAPLFNEFRHARKQ